MNKKYVGLDSNHAAGVWACDFLQVTDLFFRPLFAFFIIELQSRRVIHVNVMRSPADLWGVQQLREAAPYGQKLKYLIRENDRKFGQNFFSAWQKRVALRCFEHCTERRAQMPNDERFLGSVRRECLDRFLIF